jgi:hypothetical protein
MYRIAIMAGAMIVAATPIAFAGEAPAGPSDSGAHARIKAHHAIHYHGKSSAAALAEQKAQVDARERRETRAMNLIGAAGYQDFSDFRSEGRDFRATVLKEGQRIAVRVDPDSGKVTPEQ